MKEGKFSFSNKKQTSVMAAAAVLGLLIFSLLSGWYGRTDRKQGERFWISATFIWRRWQIRWRDILILQ